MNITEAIRQAAGSNISESGSSYTPKVLPPHKDAPPIPARSGEAKATMPSTSNSGGGVPFAELDFSKREYWPSVYVRSSDGIFAMEIKPIKSIQLDEGVATFKEPTQ